MATAVFLSNSLQGAKGEDAIGLDAVTNFKVQQKAKVSNNPVESGANVTDHYYVEPRTVSFKGVISPWNFANRGTDLKPLDFVKLVNQTMLNKTRFSLYLSDDLDSIPQCLITNFSYSREAKEGKSIEVDISAQEVQVVSRAGFADISLIVNLAEDVEYQGQAGVNAGDASPKTYLLESIYNLNEGNKQVAEGVEDIINGD